MVYDENDQDVLPEGYHQASPEEQTAYWQSRAQYKLRKLTASDRARARRERLTSQHHDSMMAEIHGNNQRLSECRHAKTELVVTPDDETDNGTVLDGSTERRCADCRKVLEVVA